MAKRDISPLNRYGDDELAADLLLYLKEAMDLVQENHVIQENPLIATLRAHRQGRRAARHRSLRAGSHPS